MRAVGYIRVSRVGDRDTDSSSYRTETDQELAIRTAAGALGAEVVEVIAERNVSGADPERAGLARALALVEDGLAEVLIVAHTDRLSRDLELTLALRRRVRAAGARLVSAAEDWDDSTPEGAMVVSIMGAVAQAERDRRKAGWHTVRSAALADGVHLGPVPFGYRRSNGRRSPLAPDPATAPLVAEAFRKRAAGTSITRIRQWLAEQGYTLAESSVRDLFGRRSYLGIAGGIDKGREGAHPALVERDLWHAAQLDAPAAPQNGRLIEAAGLRGQVYCAACGVAMWLGAGGSGNAGGKAQRARYVCKHRGECSARASAYCEDVDRIVSERLADHLAGPGIFSGAFEAVAGAEVHAEAVLAVEQARADRDSIADQVERGEIPGAMVGSITTAAERRVAEAERRAAEHSPYRAAGKSDAQLAVSRVLVEKGRGSLADRVRVEFR